MAGSPKRCILIPVEQIGIDLDQAYECAPWILSPLYNSYRRYLVRMLLLSLKILMNKVLCV